jgi:hypothetical protein
LHRPRRDEAFDDPAQLLATRLRRSARGQSFGEIIMTSGTDALGAVTVRPRNYAWDRLK